MLSEHLLETGIMGPRTLAWNAQVAVSVMGRNLSVVDRVPQDMLYLVDSHWYQFPPMDPLWYGILGFTIFVLGSTAVIGNGMVIYIFFSTKSLRTPANMLVVNLAFSDFSMMATMAPPMIINCYNNQWVFGPLWCSIYGMLGSLWGSVSIWSMVMIAFERYNVIVKGLSARPLTKKAVALQLFYIWANSILWTVSPVLGWSRYVPEGNMSACGTDYLSRDWVSRSYIISYGFFVYILPLFIIIYAYYYIVIAVAAHEKQMREQAKKMNVASLRSGEANATSAECKLAKIALVTISLWFFAWTPYLVINMTGIFESPHTTLTPLGTIWGSVFAKASAVYNPIVYGISHPKYRAVLLKKFPSLACAPPPDEPTNAETTSTSSGLTNVADHGA